MRTTAGWSTFNIFRYLSLSLAFFVSTGYSQSFSFGEDMEALFCKEKTITVTNWAFGFSAQASVDECIRGLATKCGGTLSDESVTDGPNPLKNSPSGFGTSCSGKCKIRWCISSVASEETSDVSDPLMQ